MSFNLQSLLELNPKDYGLYVQGNYVKVRIKGQKDQYQYGQMGDLTVTDDNEIAYRVWFSENDWKTIRRDQLDADFTFPKFGLYNFKKHAVLYNQNTARQWGRGLNHDAHNIVPLMEEVPYVEFLQRKYVVPSRREFWKASALTEIFLKPDTRTIQQKIEAVRLLESISVALSTNFAVSLGVYTPEPSLWFRSNLIGIVRDDNSFKINNPLFYQEAVDYLEKEGCQVHV